MSTSTSRYADYGSACPRCQQIINTIDLTFQQGIFIYDLTFIQQELESVLVAALERQNELAREESIDYKLPNSSNIRLPNGKKPRDFKAERERRRKALSGHVSRKRRTKKNSTINFFKTIKHEGNEITYLSPKKGSESNGQSYRSMNFTFPENFFDNKILINPDQFWTKILANQHEFLKPNDYQYLEKLIQIDQSLLDNLDYEKEYHQHQTFINSKEYLLVNEKSRHPQLEYSVAIQRNNRLYELVERMLNKKGKKKKKKFSRKRTYSDVADHSVCEYFHRDTKTFSSKYAELQYRLGESLQLERLALERAEEQMKFDEVLVQFNEIDEKILEITNSIRQRKRPSENAVSFASKASSPINHISSNGNNENEAWRKGRRQSTLRVYDELARLIDERMELEKQIPSNKSST